MAPDEICKRCSKQMVVKQGRFGEFLACSGFPNCKNTKTIREATDEPSVKCPKCNDGEIVVKHTKSESTFHGCTRYPACDFASWKKQTKENTPKS